MGLYVLSNPIIHILFERGAFVAEDTLYTAQVLSIFSLGLPAYILIKVLITCFFAREDTKTPLYISIVSVVINIALSLVLISTMREMGIALATSISAWANVLLLFLTLRIKKNLNLDKKFIRNSLKVIISSAILLIVCFFMNQIFFINIHNSSFIIKIWTLSLVIFSCIIIYLSMIFILKVLTISDLKGYIRKTYGKK